MSLTRINFLNLGGKSLPLAATSWAATPSSGDTPQRQAIRTAAAFPCAAPRTPCPALPRSVRSMQVSSVLGISTGKRVKRVAASGHSGSSSDLRGGRALARALRSRRNHFSFHTPATAGPCAQRPLCLMASRRITFPAECDNMRAQCPPPNFEDSYTSPPSSDFSPRHFVM
jgi:hypothetical protein